MKFEKIIIYILLISFVSCNNSKKTESKTQQFDSSNKQEKQENDSDNYVNDLERIFTKNEKEKLESFLIKLHKESGKKILVLTVPSNEKLVKDWNIQNGITNNGIIITFSVSLKNVGIGIAKDTKGILSESLREMIIKKTMIPEFENGDYYIGIYNGIEEILNNWN
jgi:uncharacterized protein